ncbi:unnamed protein product [Protopolystoma xenopodis]|uniref:Uncharacterized protein n=1 Tax=Protopolystoma xenopodis TaxID=117903 RepID=A0A3S5AVY1_9PLAT|nr:unnamed protein product [Protopolystoma xenopodis]
MPTAMRLIGSSNTANRRHRLHLIGQAGGRVGQVGCASGVELLRPGKADDEAERERERKEERDEAYSFQNGSDGPSQYPVQLRLNDMTTADGEEERWLSHLKFFIVWAIE